MNFYRFRLSNKDAVEFVKKVESGENAIEIDGVDIFVNEIKNDDVVFIVLSGDKPKWKKGLKGIAKVSSEPYDRNYSKRYFKFRVDMLLVLPEAVERSSFTPYYDLIDVAGFGYSTKGQENQALAKLEKRQAIVVVRALLDNQQFIENDLKRIFGNEFVEEAKKVVTILRQEEVKFGEIFELSKTETNLTEINEKNFMSFMKMKKKKDNTDYAEQTIVNYTSLLRSGIVIEDWIKELIPGYSNLFDIQDIELLSEFIREFVSHENYNNFNSVRKHHGPISALIHYESFLIYAKKQGMLSKSENINRIDVKRIEGGYNRIYYGSPGSGKSFKVKRLLMESGIDDEYITRTTFYQDYSYTDFVGQIYPVIIDNIPKYEFVPGPFTLALMKALSNPDKKIYLIIEEINRGNAPSIFGDLFQLLDRYKSNESGNKVGESEFPIINPSLIDYFAKKGILVDNIYIPSNLSIIATMNTSDQNVFTLDTAFKRRWDFEKVQNKFESNHSFKNWYIPGTKTTWETFVNKVNEMIISKQTKFMTSEDKQLGVYFITKNELVESPEQTGINKINMFSSKVFGYLWDDVAKFNRNEWFQNDIKTLDNLIERFISYSNDYKGLEVFEDATKFE